MHTGAEQWRAISGYEGVYEVSDRGRVRSVDRTIRHRSGGPMFLRGRVLKPGDNPATGYQHVKLCRDSKHKTQAIHVLVARAFVAGRQPGLEVCHVDGNKTNNAATNLRWDTRSGNHWDKWDHGTMMHGEGHTNSLLTASAVLAIRASSERVEALAERFGVSPWCIRDARTGKTWKWLKGEELEEVS